MPSITYNRDIPNTPNNPSNDQPLMKVNTNSIDTLLQVDHYSFSNINAGWHEQVTLPQLGPSGTSTPTTLGGQGALYTNVGSKGNTLFYIRDGNAATKVALTTSKIAAPLAASRGYTFLPGEIILQWGIESSIGSATPITFPVAFTNIYSVTISRNQNTTTSYGVGPVSTTGFTFNATSSNAGIIFYWMAIGN